MKPVKNIFLLSVGLFAFALTAHAQPDFSGNWQLNTSLSYQNHGYSMAPKTLKVRQDADSLVIEKAFDLEGQPETIIEKHTLDGKSCTNNWLRGGKSVSKALWNDQKLSLWIYSTLEIAEGTLTSSEAYYIDDAGHLVVIFEMQTGSYTLMEETYVFDKI